jgi:hypothetical protein
MKKFIVLVREVHVQQINVEADNLDEAIKIVEDGGGAMVDGTLEYSHTLDPEFWTVYDFDTDKHWQRDACGRWGKF